MLKLDVSLRSGDLVPGDDRQESVGVNLEDDVNLGLARLGALDTLDLELTEEVVTVGVAALTLEDADVNLLLVILHGGELLLLLARHRGVARDNLGERLALALDAEGQRDDVNEEEVGRRGVPGAGQNRTLHGGAEGDSLVGVNALAKRLAVEIVRQDRLHARNTGGASDEHDLVNLGLGHLGILHAPLDGFQASLEEGFANLLEPRAGVRHVNLVLADVALDVGARGRGEHALGALARGAELALRAVVAGEDIRARLLLVLRRDILGEGGVEILASQVGITRGGQHGEHAVLNLEQRDVEGTASEVKDEDVLRGLDVGAGVGGVFLVEAVRERRGGGLVDDA